MEVKNISSENAGLKSILMIEPCSFGYNEETAFNNYFQQNINIENVQAKALNEFSAFVEKLRTNKVIVNVIKDTPYPKTPDSIFPNNWISFHEGGKIVLYPMYAKNRRDERKPTVLEAIERLINIKEKIDLTYFEKTGFFLEGTGSMVLDRINKIAYACLSQRTNSEVLDVFCNEMNYTKILFHATDTNNKEIYHTNVMMCIADTYAVVCLDSVYDSVERKLLIDSLISHGKEIIEITFDQMQHFCGNMLQVFNSMNQKFMVMSSQAYQHLTKDQIGKIESYNAIIHNPLDTIELLGGGSARCMMAEVY